MLAILQVADTGPLESLVDMLEAVGVQWALPNRELRDQLRRLGCDNVTEIDDLVKNWGYEFPLEGKRIHMAGISDMFRTDVLYVDVKGHRNGPKAWKRWPNLEQRTLWYRINGGKPEHVVNARGDMGDEVNPPCPVLTPNQWYKKPWYDDSNPQQALAEVEDTTPWSRFYSCWPPFHKWGEYQAPREHVNGFGPPLCLIHNFKGWAYGPLEGPFRDKLGVQIYGRGSPDGLLPHPEARVRLSTALAMVHLKSSDAPGYAIYEALASACPVVCTRRLIWKERMQELLIPGKTCLVFDREGHQPFTPEDVVECTNEVAGHLDRLRDPKYNATIGEAGRERLRELMWRPDRDAQSLRNFLQRNYP